nr:hypothetical protein GCM10017611_44870 [Rhodococcus wratislaviensis]
MSDPVEHMMLLRIPDCWRVMFEIPEGTADEDALSDTLVSERWETLLAPAFRPDRVHQRVARSFLRDLVALIGEWRMSTHL